MHEGFVKLGNGVNATCVCAAGYGAAEVTLNRVTYSTGCEQCELGMYKDYVGTSACDACSAIDTHLTTTRTGSADADLCVCEDSSLVAVGSEPLERQCLCPPGYEYESSSRTCTDKDV